MLGEGLPGSYRHPPDRPGKGAIAEHRKTHYRREDEAEHDHRAGALLGQDPAGETQQNSPSGDGRPAAQCVHRQQRMLAVLAPGTHLCTKGFLVGSWAHCPSCCERVPGWCLGSWFSSAERLEAFLDDIPERLGLPTAKPQ